MAEASARRHAAIVTLVATLTACSDAATPSGASDPGAAAFSRAVAVNGLTLTVPDELRYRTDGFAGELASFDGFYGTVPLGPPCVTVGTGTSCGFDEFAPQSAGAVIIGIGQLPGPELLVGGAPNTSVAGIPSASSETTSMGVCEKIIDVEIRDTEQTLRVSACIVGPDISVGEAMLQAMLDSAVLSD